MSTPLDLDAQIRALEGRLNTVEQGGIARGLSDIESGRNFFTGIRRIGGQEDRSTSLLWRAQNALKNLVGAGVTDEQLANDLFDNNIKTLPSYQKARNAFATAAEREAFDAEITADPQKFIADPEGRVRQLFTSRYQAGQDRIVDRLDKLRQLQLSKQVRDTDPVNVENIAASKARRTLDQQRFGLDKEQMAIGREELGLRKQEMASRLSDLKMGRRMQAAELAMNASNTGLQALANLATRL